MRRFLKTIYYALKSEQLHPSMSLKMGYVFHTEAIQDSTTWTLLKAFCREYLDLTGVEPVCTIMTPMNARIAREMSEAGVSHDEYLSRVQELETLAILGHHGHYYRDPADYGNESGEIRGDNYAAEPVARQFLEDLSWFRENGIDHNGLYAGGWWFTHADLTELLVGQGYCVDFSFTHSPVFGHAWSRSLLREGGIRFGEPFRLAARGGDITVIQNLVGCHNTPFVEDFSRYVNALFDPERWEVTGVVNAHDFNLQANYEFTFRVLRYLASLPKVSFMGLSELSETAAREDLPTLRI